MDQTILVLAAIFDPPFTAATRMARHDPAEPAAVLGIELDLEIDPLPGSEDGSPVGVGWIASLPSDGDLADAFARVAAWLTDRFSSPPGAFRRSPDGGQSRWWEADGGVLVEVYTYPLRVVADGPGAPFTIGSAVPGWRVGRVDVLSRLWRTIRRDQVGLAGSAADGRGDRPGAMITLWSLRRPD